MTTAITDLKDWVTTEIRKHEDVEDDAACSYWEKMRAVLALIEAQEGRGWQPIETAPKDGKTAILAYGAHVDAQPFVAWFQLYEQRWFAMDPRGDRDEMMLWSAPLFWQPLPPPPPEAE